MFFAGGLTLALGWALARAKRFHAWVPLAWLVAGALPLLSYGFIYWRALHPGDAQVWPVLEPSLRSVLDHITARAYRFHLGRFAPDGAQAAWLAWYIQPYLWPGLALFTFHAFRSRGFARRLTAGALVVAAVGQTIFTFQYGVGDPDAYLAFLGEKPDLDVHNTANLLNAGPRARFRRKYGFDPLGALDEAHRGQPLRPEFVIGRQGTEGDTHAFAVIHEHIARNAGVPVIAFDPPNPPRILTPRGG